MNAPNWPDESDVQLIETAAALGNLIGVQAKADLDRLRQDPTNPKADLWCRQLKSDIQRLKAIAGGRPASLTEALKQADAILASMLASGDEQIFAAARNPDGTVDQVKLASAAMRARGRIAHKLFKGEM